MSLCPDAASAPGTHRFASSPQGVHPEVETFTPKVVFVGSDDGFVYAFARR